MTMKSIALFRDAALWRRSLRDAVVKMDPREQRRNVVMFIVWIGAALVTLTLFQGLTRFNVQIMLWLWFTVLFANWAEALAEGRGKAQADALRNTRSKTVARTIRGGNIKTVPAADLRAGDTVVCEAGDVIPADGEVVEGIATVDESAITGE